MPSKWYFPTFLTTKSAAIYGISFQVVIPVHFYQKKTSPVTVPVFRIFFLSKKPILSDQLSSLFFRRSGDLKTTKTHSNTKAMISRKQGLNLPRRRSKVRIITVNQTKKTRSFGFVGIFDVFYGLTNIVRLFVFCVLVFEFNGCWLWTVNVIFWITCK